MRRFISITITRRNSTVFTVYIKRCGITLCIFFTNPKTWYSPATNRRIKKEPAEDGVYNILYGPQRPTFGSSNNLTIGPVSCISISINHLFRMIFQAARNNPRIMAATRRAQLSMGTCILYTVHCTASYIRYKAEGGERTDVTRAAVRGTAARVRKYAKRSYNK